MTSSSVSSTAFDRAHVPPLRSARAVTHRARGRTHGPISRLMSPSDFGEILKPFVFLDLFDHEGAPFNGSLHPHSGIATLTYLAEGSVSYIDPDNLRGTLPAGGVEWMQAGRGMWHGGGLDKAGRTRGFQLWIALPPELELGPTISIYQAPDAVPQHGPARVLLGSYGSAASTIASPSPINYLAVRLKAGERWRYDPPRGHTVLWVAIASGAVSAPDELRHGDLAVFESSSDAVEFEALTDTEFVLGSAAPHEHDLVLGYYSVHT
jgi:redox-sensitive bicupin YhaK (pirin superfamily)